MAFNPPIYHTFFNDEAAATRKSIFPMFATMKTILAIKGYALAYAFTDADMNAASWVALGVPVAAVVAMGPWAGRELQRWRRRVGMAHLDRTDQNLEHREAHVFYATEVTWKDYVIGAVDGVATTARCMAPGALAFGAQKAYESLEGKLF